MNDTNRALNRIILLLTGVILLTAAAVAVITALVPRAGRLWEDGLAATLSWMRQADEQTRISEATTLSWFVLGILILLILVVVAALVVIGRLGGGRSSLVLREDAEEGVRGAVTISEGFASSAITASLAAHDEILASRVTSHRVRGEDVLHVSVTPRRNTSPAEVAGTVGVLVDNLAALLGRDLLSCITVHTGVRARLARDRPRVR